MPTHSPQVSVFSSNGPRLAVGLACRSEAKKTSTEHVLIHPCSPSAAPSQGYGRSSLVTETPRYSSCRAMFLDNLLQELPQGRGQGPKGSGGEPPSQPFNKDLRPCSDSASPCLLPPGCAWEIRTESQDSGLTGWICIPPPGRAESCTHFTDCRKNTHPIPVF